MNEARNTHRRDGPIPARAGIGLRHQHYRAVIESKPDVGWLEVHSENYFGAGGAPLHYLERIRARYPLSLHGVGMSLGSSDALDFVHLSRLKALIQRFETKGLRLVALKLVHADTKLAEQHYAVHRNKPFYSSLLKFLTSGPTVAMVWEGREAVLVARTLMGPTDGTKAAPATIRGDFAISIQNNLVHGSDSAENATSEIALWFRPDELVAFQPSDAAWIEAG